MYNSTAGLTSSQKDKVIFAMSSLNIVSYVLCVIVIALVFYYKLQKHFIYRLALYQIMSSLLLTVVRLLRLFLISSIQDHNEAFYNVTCLATAVLSVYSLWVKLIITVQLTFYIFSMVVCLKNLKSKWIEIGCILVSVLVPIPLALIPFIHGYYGPVEAWCWIMHKKSDGTDVGIIEQWLIWYAPCNLFLILCIFAVVLVAIVLWRGMKKPVEDERQPITHQWSNKHKKALISVSPLLAYPVIFFIINMLGIGTVLRKPKYCLVMVHAIAVALYGGILSLVLFLHITISRCLKKRHAHQNTDFNAMTQDLSRSISLATSNYSILRETEIDYKAI